MLIQSKCGNHDVMNLFGFGPEDEVPSGLSRQGDLRTRCMSSIDLKVILLEERVLLGQYMRKPLSPV